MESRVVTRAVIFELRNAEASLEQFSLALLAQRYQSGLARYKVIKHNDLASKRVIECIFCRMALDISFKKSFLGCSLCSHMVFSWKLVVLSGQFGLKQRVWEWWGVCVCVGGGGIDHCEDIKGKK